MSTTTTDWKDLLERLVATGREHMPSATELRDAIGLAGRRPAQPDAFGTLGVFGAGIVLGAGLAILLTPKTGSQMRKAVAEQAQDLKERVVTATSVQAPGA